MDLHRSRSCATLMQSLYDGPVKMWSKFEGGLISEVTLHLKVSYTGSVISENSLDSEVILR